MASRAVLQEQQNKAVRGKPKDGQAEAVTWRVLRDIGNLAIAPPPVEGKPQNQISRPVTRCSKTESFGAQILAIAQAVEKNNLKKDGQVHDYMNSQPEINSKMRAILVDWLIEVHKKFELMPESLYLTRTGRLENMMDDLKVSVGNRHGSTDGKMRQLENILNEVVQRRQLASNSAVVEASNSVVLIRQNAMSSVFEIVYSLVELMTQPLLLVNLCYQFGIRTTFRLVQTWIELLRSAVCLPLTIFWKLILWTTAIFSLPIRAFTALYRERLLAMQLYRMKTELDYLLWERKELDGRLNVATKERKAVEKLLKELEDENDEAIVKIELLEREVQDLKDAMQRLKEVHGKSLGDCEEDATYNKNVCGVPGKTNHLSNIHIPEQQDKTDMIAKDGEILARQRKLARTQSFFSATMSLVVGIIV